MARRHICARHIAVTRSWKSTNVLCASSARSVSPATVLCSSCSSLPARIHCPSRRCRGRVVGSSGAQTDKLKSGAFLRISAQSGNTPIGKMALSVRICFAEHGTSNAILERHGEYVFRAVEDHRLSCYEQYGYLHISHTLHQLRLGVVFGATMGTGIGSLPVSLQMQMPPSTLKL